MSIPNTIPKGRLLDKVLESLDKQAVRNNDEQKRNTRNGKKLYTTITMNKQALATLIETRRIEQGGACHSHSQSFGRGRSN